MATVRSRVESTPRSICKGDDLRLYHAKIRQGGWSWNGGDDTSMINSGARVIVNEGILDEMGISWPIWRSDGIRIYTRITMSTCLR
jgi:hypothetical protein